jgi:hypothetical protein
MKNTKFDTFKVKSCCEKKLGIEFRKSRSAEFNGWFIFGNKKVARVTVPKGRKFIPPKTYKAMAAQLKLTIEEFDNLLECPLKRNNYEDIIKMKVL